MLGNRSSNERSALLRQRALDDARDDALACLELELPQVRVRLVVRELSFVARARAFGESAGRELAVSIPARPAAGVRGDCNIFCAGGIRGVFFRLGADALDVVFTRLPELWLIGVAFVGAVHLR